MKFLFLFVLAFASAFSESTFVSSSHSITLNNKQLNYTATQGTLPILDKEGKTKGELFFVAYSKERAADEERGVAFCFNGGPGSSSVWLHLGLLGPKCVLDHGNEKVAPPYGYQENPYTLLDVVDLVFIDPMSTGFSRPAEGVEAKQFHGMQEDIESLAKFIRLYCSEFQRWEDPKYLIGESYGTTRACGLALHLHDIDYIYLNGIILISAALDYQTFCETQATNDLPALLSFPTYAATAWHFGKVDKKKSLDEHVKEAEKFAFREYGQALLLGNLISVEEKKKLAERMSELIGIDAAFIIEKNLRLCSSQFRKKLLEKDNQVIGRFDARKIGWVLPGENGGGVYDPSFEAILGVYTGAINGYLENELGVKRKEPYEVLNQLSWNFGDAVHGFPSVSKDLSEVLVKNPDLKVFIASGLFDLATPYFASEYVVHHLRAPPAALSRIVMHTYPSGHMMYTDDHSVQKLHGELKAFLLSK